MATIDNPHGQQQNRHPECLCHRTRWTAHTLQGIGYVEQALQQLKVLADIDNNLTRAHTQLINYIRSALVDIHPAFEQALHDQVIHHT